MIRLLAGNVLSVPLVDGASDGRCGHDVHAVFGPMMCDQLSQVTLLLFTDLRRVAGSKAGFDLPDERFKLVDLRLVFEVRVVLAEALILEEFSYIFHTGIKLQ